jgi:hypothetical protein
VNYRLRTSKEKETTHTVNLYNTIIIIIIIIIIIPDGVIF